MKTNLTVNLINKVIRNYGLNIYNDPIFRVVFSDDQIEKRRGTFNEYHRNLFIRTVYGIKEVQKYPWIRGKWILERWASGELAHHNSLETDRNGVYVCVYIFQDVNCNYLPPLLKVAEIIIDNLLHPRNKDEAINQDLEIEINKEEEEIDKIETELKIESDEAARKDRKSYRESASIGYSKSLIEKRRK